MRFCIVSISSALVEGTTASSARTIPSRWTAWLDVQVEGGEMTAALFARGIGQTLRVQRQAIERVVGEQVADAEPIERSLAEAPIPAEDVEEAQPELISWVGAATGAHMTALAQIAVDLENRVRDSYGDSTE